MFQSCLTGCVCLCVGAASGGAEEKTADVEEEEAEEEDEDVEEVFTVELHRGPHGLGLALVDGMVRALNNLLLVCQSESPVLIWIVSNQLLCFHTL